MIVKNNSFELMNRFKKAEQDINNIAASFEDLKNNLETKTKVLAQNNDYALWLLNKIKEKKYNTNKILLADEDKIIAGAYGIYGSTVHPRFLSSSNLFNLKTSLGYVYKDIATVSINEEEKKEYTNILKEDSISGKTPILEKYQGQDVKVKIEINTDSIFVERDFNVIELCPFLPGSFSISEIRIEESLGDIYTYPGDINKTGLIRICLPKTLKLKSIIFFIHLEYQTEDNLYPFGFKHIYFLNAKLGTSSIIVPVEKNGYIDYISEEITVHDQYGIHRDAEDTCKKWHIKLYMHYSNDQLMNEIIPLYGTNQSYLSRNIRTFYMEIPITTSLVSVDFKNIQLK